MNEKLIAGYTAYTTADEYGTAAVANAPATTPFAVTAAVLGGAFIAGGSYAYHC